MKSVYNILSDFGFTYDKYDEEHNCYIKDGVVIYFSGTLNAFEFNYECSIYINGEFYTNTTSNEELSNSLTTIERDEKIIEILRKE